MATVCSGTGRLLWIFITLAMASSLFCSRWCETRLGQRKGAISDKPGLMSSTKYFWCADESKSNSSDDTRVLRVFLQSASDSSKDLQKISALLYYRGLHPLITGYEDSYSEGDNEVFDSRRSWRFLSKGYAQKARLTLHTNRDTVSLGYFVAQSSYPTLNVSPREEGSLPTSHLKPSSRITGKVFSSACLPDRSIFATDKFLLSTYNGFEHFTKLVVDREFASDDLKNKLVSAIVVSEREAFMLIHGDLYVAEETDDGTKLSIVTFGETGELTGISSATICYNSIEQDEKSAMYAWSNQSLYRVFRRLSGEIVEEKIELNGTSETVGKDFSLISVHQTLNPTQILLLLVANADHRRILRCTLRRKTIVHCIDVTVPGSFKDSKDLAVTPTSSALPSLIIWDSDQFAQIVGSQVWLQEYPSKIAQVSINSFKNEWLVQVKNGATYLGRVHSHVMTNLTVPHQSKSSSYIFVRDTVRRISWSLNSVVPSLEIDSFHIADILGDTSQKGYRKVLQSPLPGDVISIESLNGNFSVKVYFLTSSLKEYTCVVYRDFQNLSLVTQTKEYTSTRRFSRSSLVRTKMVEVEVAANCANDRQSCKTGYAVLEVSCQPTEAVHASFGLSKVFLINMTCPAGLNLRLSPKIGENELFSSAAIRRIKVRKDRTIYLEFQLFYGDEYFANSGDDILLTELHNQTGFTFADFNLLKKTCYPCSHFVEPNSSSQLMLQTMKSACPCIEAGEHERVGNLSFDFATAGQNEFHFSAQAIGDSLCDLRTVFIVELVADPSLEFLFWEILFLSICVSITVVSVFTSYHNYIQHMRTNREIGRHRDATSSSSG